MRPSAVPVAFVIALITHAAPAQDPQSGPPQGTARERMWYAPTAEDWQKPVLITFQRTWADALAVSKATKKPILVCVNMDGEIASEHYAGIRYRQPEMAKLYEPYVCVIASVYRHTPRDHDEHGNRIPCPRFGSVTCGEHIAIEPILYEKFMDGERVAPRHIMVELDGQESYDVYYTFDTQSVFAAIEGGIANRAIQPEPVVRGDRTLVERVASRDIADREAVEQAYREGDEELRRALLAAAAEHPDAAPTDLLRLAVFGFDAELSERARGALAKLDAPGAADLIAEALRVPMDAEQRESLIAALERIGTESAHARTLAVVHRGLDGGSGTIDATGWKGAAPGGASYAPPPAHGTLESRLEEQSDRLAERPDDAEARLEMAETSLALAVDPKTNEILAADPRSGSKYARLMFEDARRAALDAERLGAPGWRVDAVIAVASHHLGDAETAATRAESAAANLPAGTQHWTAIAALALFADARHRAIVAAARAKQDWPGAWLKDASEAYSILARHPLGTDVQVASHYDLLSHLGARGRAARVLDQGLERFPGSATLHDCLRSRILRERGAEGLLAIYAEMLAAPEAHPSLPWFAGYAAIVAAEFARRRGETEDASAAYARTLELFDAAIAADPSCASTADHYAALAHAGRARLALEAGDLQAALDALLASFDRAPRAAASQDGLNISPADTARMLRARLDANAHGEQIAKLDAALAELRALDPTLLDLPAYERSGAGPRRGRRGR